MVASPCFPSLPLEPDGPLSPVIPGTPLWPGMQEYPTTHTRTQVHTHTHILNLKYLKVKASKWTRASTKAGQQLSRLRFLYSLQPYCYLFTANLNTI